MKYLTHVTFHLLYLAVSLTFLSVMTLAVETSQSQVLFADNRLTVEVKDVSLVWLLQEIARQSGLTLEYNGSLEERVTIRFNNLPIDEGLRRILHEQNFALEYVQERQEKNQSTVLRPVNTLKVHAAR
jgi:type II secretory pathway component HofQ